MKPGSAVPSVLFGVFIGGSSSRMGRPKGLLQLRENGPSLVEQTFSRCDLLNQEGELPFLLHPVLVGEQAAYRDTPWVQLADAAPGQGPLGGLVSLLREARRLSARGALALSCDLPFVSASSLKRLLLQAGERPRAYTREDRLEPLCAYYPLELLPLAEAQLQKGRLALHQLLRLAPELELLELTFPQELQDCDTPEDWEEARARSLLGERAD